MPNEENLKEEIKGLANEVREWLIQEAKNRGWRIDYNEDGSIDFMESGDIDGIHILKQGWSLSPPFDFEEQKDSEKGSE